MYSARLSQIFSRRTDLAAASVSRAAYGAAGVAPVGAAGWELTLLQRTYLPQPVVLAQAAPHPGAEGRQDHDHQDLPVHACQIVRLGLAPVLLETGMKGDRREAEMQADRRVAEMRVDRRLAEAVAAFVAVAAARLVLYPDRAAVH
jgi:hypothetical protein